MENRTEAIHSHCRDWSRVRFDDLFGIKLKRLRQLSGTGDPEVVRLVSPIGYLMRYMMARWPKCAERPVHMVDLLNGELKALEFRRDLKAKLRT